MPLSSILVPLSSIFINFLSDFRSTLWPFSQLLSAYLINILSVVLLVCLPYLEVFPVLTLFSFHSIAVQILKEIFTPSKFQYFCVVIGPGPETHKRLVPGEIG